ncbi:MAG: methylenetetrahydrofolate reductase [Acidimicrobiales bacterium]
MRYEVVPLKNLDDETKHLPAGCVVSVTCSPTKGIFETIAITNDLIDRGYRAIPHIAARLVVDRAQTRDLAAWMSDRSIPEIFVIAGDAETPAGCYEGAVPFLSDLLEEQHGLSHIGVTSYPDGHPAIDRRSLDSALQAKQAMLAEAGIAGHATTQMCFDVARIDSWLTGQRDAGVTLPIHLGLPGVINRVKLMTMGSRLGIGASMRFVKKNSSAVGKLLTSSGYDPLELLRPLAPRIEELGITGLHIFTFNNVESTAKWQSGVLGA